MVDSFVSALHFAEHSLYHSVIIGLSVLRNLSVKSTVPCTSSNSAPRLNDFLRYDLDILIVDICNFCNLV